MIVPENDPVAAKCTQNCSIFFVPRTVIQNFAERNPVTQQNDSKNVEYILVAI
jgi:hypothetical protein